MLAQGPAGMALRHYGWNGVSMAGKGDWQARKRKGRYWRRNSMVEKGAIIICSVEGDAAPNVKLIVRMAQLLAMASCCQRMCVIIQRPYIVLTSGVAIIFVSSI